MAGVDHIRIGVRRRFGSVIVAFDAYLRQFSDGSTMIDEFSEWLDSVPDGDRPLAASVIAFVRETLDDADEAIKWNNPCFVVDGSNCLYVSAQDGYVNLGFYEGARLDDPAGLLEGTGEVMRHVKVRSSETLEDPSLSELVRSAAAHTRG